MEKKKAVAKAAGAEAKRKRNKSWPRGMAPPSLCRSLLAERYLHFRPLTLLFFCPLFYKTAATMPIRIGGSVIGPVGYGLMGRSALLFLLNATMTDGSSL